MSQDVVGPVVGPTLSALQNVLAPDAEVVLATSLVVDPAAGSMLINGEPYTALIAHPGPKVTNVFGDMFEVRMTLIEASAFLPFTLDAAGGPVFAGRLFPWCITEDGVTIRHRAGHMVVAEFALIVAGTVEGIWWNYRCTSCDLEAESIAEVNRHNWNHHRRFGLGFPDSLVCRGCGHVITPAVECHCHEPLVSDVD